MDFHTALEYIKANDKAAYAIKKKEKEIFIMEYDDGADRFADIIISWAQETSESTSTVGNYKVDEALEEHPAIEKMNFILIEKDGSSALDMVFSYGVEILKENEI